MSKKGNLTVEMVQKIVCNPFYAINIEPDLGIKHPLMISEEDWIKANVNSIKDDGAEVWLKRLLDVLKGNYVISEEEK